MNIKIEDLKGKTPNERLKILRKHYKYTQEELGSKLNMTRTSYSKLERQGRIRIQLALEIAYILDIRPELLFVSDEILPDYINKDFSNALKSDDEIKLSIPEKNAILQLRHLNPDEQNHIFNIINAIYKKIKNNGFLIR